MNWDNLKTKQCPACGRRLLLAHLYMRCSGRKGGVYKIKLSSLCTFTIGKGKYAELGGFIPAQHRGSYHFLTSTEREKLKLRREKEEAETKERRRLKKIRKRNRVINKSKVEQV